MEDDFYATIKLKSGEEIFAKVAASEEEGRTMLVVHNPITVDIIKGKGGYAGFKLEPWLKTTTEDLFVINLDDVLTLSESFDMEIIMMHQTFVRKTDNSNNNSKSKKLDRSMGYISTVNDAKLILEKIFKIEKEKDS
jgi:hypothetical protein